MLGKQALISDSAGGKDPGSSAPTPGKTTLVQQHRHLRESAEPVCAGRKRDRDTCQPPLTSGRVRRDECWWSITEPGIELPNTPEISSDVAGWRRERMPEMPGDEPIRVVPDWTCEILSKTTRRHDLEVKMPYYAKVGVAYHWLVDIEKRVLTAHRLEASEWRVIGTYSNETEARIPPFETVSLNIASRWPPASPKGSR